MAKRIYVGLKDPRVAADIAARTGIDAGRLQKAAAGELELSTTEQERVDKALAGRR